MSCCGLIRLKITKGIQWLSCLIKLRLIWVLNLKLCFYYYYYYVSNGESIEIYLVSKCIARTEFMFRTRNFDIIRWISEENLICLK